MALRKIYFGSLGPFVYDDTDLINDYDGDFAGQFRGAIVTDGNISGSSPEAFDTDGSDKLEFKWNENDTANRILNFLVNGADRTIDLSDDLVIVAGSGVIGTFNKVTKTAAYTLTTADTIVFANGTFILTLPTAVGIDGKVYYIKNIGTGIITIDADDIETIDGGLTAVLDSQYESVTVTSDSDNSDWGIL